MPLAWQARLTPKEVAMFKTLYGEVRLSESYHAQLFKLVIGSRAAGTVSAYTASINRWTAFAKKNGFKEFPPDPHQFSIYITHLSEKRASFSTFKMIKASFPFYYASRNCEDICITNKKFVALILDGAMRKAAKERGPVKKATTLGEEDIRDFLQTNFWPRQSVNIPNPNLKDWRTGVRLYSYYMTLCRWDCYSHLTRDSITFFGDHLIISFPTRKNDKLYEGSTCVLKFKPGDPLCPRLIFKTYFDIMNFKSGEDVLNCRLTRDGKLARPRTKLSYGQSLQDSKAIMRKYGLPEISEKSFKASGVTTLLDNKTPLTDVQIYGGWKTEQTVMFYHNSSVNRRKEISSFLLQ